MYEGEQLFREFADRTTSSPQPTVTTISASRWLASKPAAPSTTATEPRAHGEQWAAEPIGMGDAPAAESRSTGAPPVPGPAEAAPSGPFSPSAPHSDPDSTAWAPLPAEDAGPASIGPETSEWLVPIPPAARQPTLEEGTFVAPVDDVTAADVAPPTGDAPADEPAATEPSDAGDPAKRRSLRRLWPFGRRRS